MALRAEQVCPQRWSEITVLFDNGAQEDVGSQSSDYGRGYSVIAGVYRGVHVSRGRRLGERWNGPRDDIGFPRQGAHPIWHAIPSLKPLSFKGSWPSWHVIQSNRRPKGEGPLARLRR